MTNYELLNLSFFEFENLTRDLLEKKFNIYIESFTSGSDQGIDLRFAFDNSKACIVQCKRFKTFSSLYSSLKKEISKIKKLNVNKYYVSTTVPLTPQQKEKIFKLFQPYIKKHEDIFGKDDINKMLSEFKDVELKYYKLWLSSTNVLNSILHSKVYNVSEIDVSDINKNIKKYVQNESYNSSLKILEENNYIIISGIPGIGKTTLAKILIYNFLAKGFTEYISLTDSINDAFKLYHESKSQVFFYDDFLGRNFLEDKLMKNEDNLLLKFITKIKESKNKVLIMTTREYILHQAQEKYELLNNNRINIAKTILDISTYTKIIKAQILYNHLFFSSIPQQFIFELLNDKKYLEIIEHENYNPRIIETIIENEEWKQIDACDYFKTFISYFDNPESVWKHAFENQISELSQIILLLLVTSDTPILYEDLKIILNTFCQTYHSKYNFSYSEMNFNKALKEIENSFIVFQKDVRNQIAIEFINPSIFDFLFNFIKCKMEIIEEILMTAIYINQFFYIFLYDKSVRSYHGKKNIKISNAIKKNVIKRLVNDHPNFISSNISKIHYYNEKGFVWTKNTNNTLSNITLINEHIDIKQHKELSNLLLKDYENVLKKQINNNRLYNVIQLYPEFKDDMKLDSDDFIEKIFSNVVWVDDISSFIEFKKILPEEYQTFTRSKSFQERLSDIVDDDYYNIDEDSIENLITNLELIQTEFGMNFEYKIASLHEKLEEIDKDAIDETDAYRKIITSQEENANNIDTVIDNMFESLNYRDIKD